MINCISCPILSTNEHFNIKIVAFLNLLPHGIKIIWIFLVSMNINASDLNVCVASDYRYVATIIESFQEKNPNVNINLVKCSFRSMQEMNDLFKGVFDIILFSGDVDTKKLGIEHVVAENYPKTYAYGRLTLWHNQSKYVPPEHIADYLLQKDPLTIVIEPYNTHYGQRAIEVMQSLDIYEQLNKQGVIKVSDKANDAGGFPKIHRGVVSFVELSLLILKSEPGCGIFTDRLGYHAENYCFTKVPQGLHTSIKHQIIIFKNDNVKLSRQFSDFMLSPKVQEEFDAWGYTPVRKQIAYHKSVLSTSSVATMTMVLSANVVVGLAICILACRSVYLSYKLRRIAPAIY